MCSKLYLYIYLSFSCTTTNWNSLITSFMSFALTKLLFLVPCSIRFLFHCRSFSPYSPLTFLIFSPPKNVQLFLQHCCKTSWIANVARLTTHIKPVLKQIRLQGLFSCVVKRATSLYRTLKFSACVSNEIHLLCFSNLALALSLLSTSTETLFKYSWVKDSALLLLLFSLSKRPGGQDDHNMDVYLQVYHRFQAPDKVKRHFTLFTLWWADGRTVTWLPKFSDAWITKVSYLSFCARFARERAPLKSTLKMDQRVKGRKGGSYLPLGRLSCYSCHSFS